VRFLGGLWDQELLDQLYANAATYVHGHSVGGTNPSLLRAMGAGAPVLAHDNVFNREVTGGYARYFATREQLGVELTTTETDLKAARDTGEAGQQHVKTTYRWDAVADAYLALASELARPQRNALGRTHRD
jgi:glycosyltransferase involved in cell wall biosynthesis